MASREVFITADGSASLHVASLNEQYHSKHGALQESAHIYITNGFNHLAKKNLRVLEMGFGTGLNALLTGLEAVEKQIRVHYTSLEKYPLQPAEVKKLNYPEIIGSSPSAETFKKIHNAPWGSDEVINTFFTLKKLRTDFREFTAEAEFQLIYFDAFGPEVQPHLWTAEIMGSMYNCLEPGGVLVTYSAKGSVRKIMDQVGFRVERLPGPPGKRHMVRATKQA